MKQPKLLLRRIKLGVLLKYFSQKFDAKVALIVAVGLE
jgi:hypothetical protein